jgi:hypothetical protein
MEVLLSLLILTGAENVAQKTIKDCGVSVAAA